MSQHWIVPQVVVDNLAPVGQAPPSSSIPIPLPCPSNGMLPSNPTMSSLPTPCTIESPALSPKLIGHVELVRQCECGAVPICNLCDGQGYVVLFEQASNTFYVTMDTVYAAAITAAIVPLLTMKHVSYPLLNAPDGFDAVSVQNVGSTYIIVSWDLPTDSNGILINFSLYCNSALAVLPLTMISYNTTGLLPFTLYMHMSSSHARRHCTPVGMWCWASSVLQRACPGLWKMRSASVSESASMGMWTQIG
ncbi:hypothetical protein EMCRGX_G034976 [Ephydatia muelleri]